MILLNESFSGVFWNISTKNGHTITQYLATQLWIHEIKPINVDI